MNEQNKQNRGALFKNDRKERDTQPDYNGSLNVDGQDYWLSAWLEESKSGTKYFSLSVQLKDQQTKPQSDAVADVDLNEPINLSDIPF